MFTIRLPLAVALSLTASAVAAIAEIPDARPGAAPTVAGVLLGTWRARLEDSDGEAKVYTFTADGRVTVAPGQICRYRAAGDMLAIDCVGDAVESASGPLERLGPATILWTVGGRTVRFERDAGVKEQP